MRDWTMIGKPALILIHMQHAITSEAGKLAFLGHAKATRESGIINRQQALLKAFRAKGLPVIYVNAVHKPTSKLPVYGKFWSVMQNMEANLPNSRDIEAIPELAPLPAERVLGNFPFGMFTGSDLDKVLRDEKVETLVLTGVATDMAVLTAVIQAADLYYNIIVPSDASTSASLEAHNAVINLMMPAMALVTPTDDVLAHL